MNYRRTVPILAALALSLVGASAVLGAERPRIAVMEIDDRSESLKPKLVADLTEHLRGALTATERYVVIDKTRQAEALKRIVVEQQKESYKQCYDKTCQIPLGQALSADSILRTTLTLIGGVYTFTAEVVDLEKQASLGGAQAECDAEPRKRRDRRLLGALKALVGKLGEPGAGRRPAPLPPEEQLVANSIVTPPSGRLEVTSAVALALRVGQKVVGPLSGDGKPTELILPAGEHVLTAWSPQHGLWRETVTVRGGEDTAVVARPSVKRTSPKLSDAPRWVRKGCEGSTKKPCGVGVAGEGWGAVMGRTLAFLHASAELGRALQARHESSLKSSGPAGSGDVQTVFREVLDRKLKVHARGSWAAPAGDTYVWVREIDGGLVVVEGIGAGDTTRTGVSREEVTSSAEVAAMTMALAELGAALGGAKVQGMLEMHETFAGAGGASSASGDESEESSTQGVSRLELSAVLGPGLAVKRVIKSYQSQSVKAGEGGRVVNAEEVGRDALELSIGEGEKPRRLRFFDGFLTDVSQPAAEVKALLLGAMRSAGIDVQQLELAGEADGAPIVRCRLAMRGTGVVPVPSR
jgi:hypothetical protein